MSDITLRQAQQLVDDWMRERGWTYWHPLAQLARMTEELGELARLVNHLYGEKPKKIEEPEQELALEMADLLYTMICLANSQGIDVQTALEKVLEKYGTRDAERYGPPLSGGTSSSQPAVGTSPRPSATPLHQDGEGIGARLPLDPQSPSPPRGEGVRG